jgi:hypothetical protein
VVRKPGGKRALAASGRSTDPENTRIYMLRPPLVDLGGQPFSSDEAIEERIDIARLRYWREILFKFLDLASEALDVRTFEQCEDFLELGAIPLLPCAAALSVMLLPVLHVEPFDVADRDRWTHFLLCFDENRRDGAALDIYCNRKLIEAYARLS